MTLRRVPLVLLAVLAVPLAVARAQSPAGSVDVVVVTGPMDHRTVEFVTDAIVDTEASLVVLQMNVGAVVGGDLTALEALIADAPVPVAVWVGPHPASLQGAAVSLLAAAPLRGAAPGVRLGRVSPAFAGGEPVTPHSALPAEMVDGLVAVEGPIPELVEVIAPSIGQFVVGLHGATVILGSGPVTLDTARTETIDGVERLVPAAPVRFVSEGIIDRVLHSAARPEALFFFLLAGVALAIFEFYAAGPGLAAAVGAGLLMLSGYGLAVLPIWWPALGAVALGVLLLVADLQRNDLRWRTVLGVGLLLLAGFRLVDGGPHLKPSWWVVGLIVTGIALFFAFALTTVVRARFSLPTIGREDLIGRRGTALGAVAPEGEVEVDGARWPARAARQSGIQPGDAVVVTGIQGPVLTVDPADLP